MDDVAEERGLDREAVLAIADGRPMTGRQALEAGLVDRMGDFHAAIACAAAMAKIEGKPTLVRKNERSNPLMDLLQRFADPGNSSSRLFHFRPNLRLEYRLF